MDICKTYSICKCAHETTFIVDEGSKFYLKILFENDNINDLIIIKRALLGNKYNHLLSLKTKKEYDDFNSESNLKYKIRILSQIAQKELLKVKNNTS